MRRLILFDIDGTLVRGGPARGAFEAALIAVFGTAGPIDSHEFSGKTDPQIARELLRLAGLSDPDIDRGLPGLYRRYLAELEARLPSNPVTRLPGVAELLAALETEADVALGLLTGNIREGARLKLESAIIATRFEVGAFGSDAEHRDDLPAVALERALLRWARAFDPEDVVVVGDTPRDIDCGRGSGMRTVGVATGRFSLGDLVDAGADLAFEGLDSAGVLSALRAGS